MMFTLGEILKVNLVEWKCSISPIFGVFGNLLENPCDFEAECLAVMIDTAASVSPSIIHKVS